MRISVVAALIVGVHVAVIGSVVMTQGCASTRTGESSAMPAQVEPPPPPVLAPSVAVEPAPVTKVSFPEIKPPVKPEPVKASVAAENVYVIKKGDSLSKIAVRHGVNTRELAELNQIFRSQQDSDRPEADPAGLCQAVHLPPGQREEGHSRPGSQESRCACRRRHLCGEVRRCAFQDCRALRREDQGADEGQQHRGCQQDPDWPEAGDPRRPGQEG